MTFFLLDIALKFTNKVCIFNVNGNEYPICDKVCLYLESMELILVNAKTILSGKSMQRMKRDLP